MSTAIGVNHTVRDEIDRAMQQIGRMREEWNIPDGYQPVIDRADDILLALKSRLAMANQSLVNAGILGPMQTAVQNMTNASALAVQNNNANHLSGFNGWADQLVQYVYQIPIVETSSEAEGVRAALISMRRSLSQHERQLREERQKLQEQNRAVSDQINSSQELMEHAESLSGELQGKLDGLSEQFGEKFNDEAEERNNGFQEKINGWEARFNQETSAREQYFNNEVEGYRENVDQEIETIHTNAQDQLSQQMTAFGELMDTWRGDAENVLQTLEKYKEEAAVAAGTVATTSYAGAYKQTADSAQKSARYWRMIAAIAFGALGVAALVEFYLDFAHPVHSFNWSLFSGRIIVSGAIAAFAGYAATQAAGHAKDARYNRRMEMTMKALNPYLESLDPEQQRQIKVELARVLFTNPEVATTEEKEEAVQSPQQILNLLTTLASSWHKQW